MKLGDWVTWTNGTSAGEVTAFTKTTGGKVVAHVRRTRHHPTLSQATYVTVPYPYEELTVVPEAIAKIINS